MSAFIGKKDLFKFIFGNIIKKKQNMLHNISQVVYLPPNYKTLKLKL